jgi:methylenetetrahydrofolate reductase (NADPH)
VPRLAKKVAAGVEFIQTQCIFNVAKFREWMKGVVDRGLHEKVFILGGVTPCKSFGMAKYMANNVPGMDVPEELLKRMKDTPKEKQAEEGITIAVETKAAQEIPGVAGVHLMAIEWEEKVGEMVKKPACFPPGRIKLSENCIGAHAPFYFGNYTQFFPMVTLTPDHPGQFDSPARDEAKRDTVRL